MTDFRDEFYSVTGDDTNNEEIRMKVKRTYEVDVLGRLWMPMCLAATTEHFEAEGKEEAIEKVYMLGDFSSIEDFSMIETTHFHRINVDRCVKEWDNADNECSFLDCMYPYEE